MPAFVGLITSTLDNVNESVCTFIKWHMDNMVILPFLSLRLFPWKLPGQTKASNHSTKSLPWLRDVSFFKESCFPIFGCRIRALTHILSYRTWFPFLLFSGHGKFLKISSVGVSLLNFPHICSPSPDKARLGSLLTMKPFALNTGLTPTFPRRDIVLNFKVDILNDQSFRKWYFAKNGKYQNSWVSL